MSTSRSDAVDDQANETNHCICLSLNTFRFVASIFLLYYMMHACFKLGSSLVSWADWVDSPVVSDLQKRNGGRAECQMGISLVRGLSGKGEDRVRLKIVPIIREVRTGRPSQV